MSITTPITGTLKLHFVKANGLPRKQMLGKQDPYVTVQFGDVRCKSKVSENGDKDPEWNDLVKIDLKEQKEFMISFFVKNSNLGKDDDIGAIRMPIYALLSHQGQEKAYPLYKTTKNRMRAGQITLKAELEGKGGMPPSNGTEWGIEEAQFGAGQIQADVKGYLNIKATLCHGTLEFKKSEPLSRYFGFDPLDGHEKSLILKYKKGGVVYQLEIKENHSDTKIVLEKPSEGAVVGTIVGQPALGQPIVAPAQPVVHAVPVQTYGQPAVSPQPIYKPAPPVQPAVQPAVYAPSQPTPAPDKKDPKKGPAPSHKVFIVSKHTGNVIQNNADHKPQAANKNKEAWEEMAFEYESNGVVFIKSLKTGNYLQCDEGGNCKFANKNKMLWESWKVIQENGHYFLQSMHTKNILQVSPEGHVKAANANKQAWEQLDFHFATPVPVGGTCYLKSAHGNVIQNGGDGKAVAANANKGPWEAVQFKELKEGTFVIKSMKDENNLQCDNNGSCQFANKNEGPWECFKIQKKGNHIFLVAHTGNVVQVTDKGVVRAANKNMEKWEQLSIEF